MQCPRCHFDNLPHSKYCRRCGFELATAPVKGRITKAWDKMRRMGKSSLSYAPHRKLHWRRLIATVAILAAVILLSFAGYKVTQALSSLPSLSTLVNLSTAGQDSVIYDRFNKPVAYLHLDINRIDVPLSAISPNMRNALVAIEDHNFWIDDGLNLRSIGRAAIHDVLHQGGLQGASTITEQLAKMLYLHDNRSITYKLQEIALGLELSRRYSKSQILDMYLNEVYLGQGAYGVDTAAKAYFNESPSHLSLAQASLLAGLPQAPSLYDPLVHLKLAKQRQWQVLSAMAKYGYITPSQAKAAFSAPLDLRPHAVTLSEASLPYPWYIQHVIHVLEHQGYSLQEIDDGGLKIYTELDPTAYTIAQRAVDEWMTKNFGSNPVYEAAVMVEDPHNGAVWAVIGGRTYQGSDPEDLATNPSVQRSTGSSIKPLMEYSEAIMKGYTQMSVIQDVPIFQNIDGQAWWPKNDDHLYRGYMDLRDALAISDNDVAVHLLKDIGIQTGFHFATKDFGLPLPQIDSTQYGVAIGGFDKGGVNVLDMTRAYATFPNNGVMMTPIWVRKVVRQDGSVAYQDSPHAKTLFSPQVAYIMDQMMQWVLKPQEIPSIGPGAYATGYDLGIGRPAAGKTGTNNGERDAWFMGYEPQMVVGVWEGNEKGELPQPSTPSGPAYGDVAAGPIWRQIMEQINQQEHISAKPFPRPPGMVYVAHVSITSGMLAGPLTPKDDIEGAWFIRGTQPKTIGHHHEEVTVLASDPHELWEPGCGPAVSADFLVPESDWHVGVPLPWDSLYWPPTTRCQPTPAGPPTTSFPNRPPHGPPGPPPHAPGGNPPPRPGGRPGGNP